MMLTPGLFLGLLVIAVAVYDFYVISKKGKRASISAWAIKTSYKYPSIVFIVAFGLGYVFGHTTWRMRTLDIYECKDAYVKEIIRECSDE